MAAANTVVVAGATWYAHWLAPLNKDLHCDKLAERIVAAGRDETEGNGSCDAVDSRSDVSSTAVVYSRIVEVGESHITLRLGLPIGAVQADVAERFIQYSIQDVSYVLATSAERDNHVLFSSGNTHASVTDEGISALRRRVFLTEDVRSKNFAIDPDEIDFADDSPDFFVDIDIVGLTAGALCDLSLFVDMVGVANPAFSSAVGSEKHTSNLASQSWVTFVDTAGRCAGAALLCPPEPFRCLGVGQTFIDFSWTRPYAVDQQHEQPGAEAVLDGWREQGREVAVASIGYQANSSYEIKVCRLPSPSGGAVHREEVQRIAVNPADGSSQIRVHRLSRAEIYFFSLRARSPIRRLWGTWGQEYWMATLAPLTLRISNIGTHTADVHVERDSVQLSVDAVAHATKLPMIPKDKEEVIVKTISCGIENDDPDFAGEQSCLVGSSVGIQGLYPGGQYRTVAFDDKEDSDSPNNPSVTFSTAELPLAMMTGKHEGVVHNAEDDVMKNDFNPCTTLKLRTVSESSVDIRWLGENDVRSTQVHQYVIRILKLEPTALKLPRDFLSPFEESCMSARGKQEELKVGRQHVRFATDTCRYTVPSLSPDARYAVIVSAGIVQQPPTNAGGSMRRRDQTVVFGAWSNPVVFATLRIPRPIITAFRGTSLTLSLELSDVERAEMEYSIEGLIDMQPMQRKLRYTLVNLDNPQAVYNNVEVTSLTSRGEPVSFSVTDLEEDQRYKFRCQLCGVDPDRWGTTTGDFFFDVCCMKIETHEDLNDSMRVKFEADADQAVNPALYALSLFSFSRGMEVMIKPPSIALRSGDIHVKGLTCDTYKVSLLVVSELSSEPRHAGAIRRTMPVLHMIPRRLEILPTRVTDEFITASLVETDPYGDDVSKFVEGPFGVFERETLPKYPGNRNITEMDEDDQRLMANIYEHSQKGGGGIASSKASSIVVDRATIEYWQVDESLRARFNEDERKQVSVSSASSGTTIPKLKDDTIYAMRARTSVRSVHNSETRWSPWTEPIFVKTFKRLSIACTSAGETFINLQWKKPYPWEPLDSEPVGKARDVRLGKNARIDLRRFGFYDRNPKNYLEYVYHWEYPFELKIAMEGSKRNYVVLLPFGDMGVHLIDLQPGLKYVVSLCQMYGDTRGRSTRRLVVQTHSDLNFRILKIGCTTVELQSVKTNAPADSPLKEDKSEKEANLAVVNLLGHADDEDPNEESVEVNFVQGYEIRLDTFGRFRRQDKPLHHRSVKSSNLSAIQTIEFTGLEPKKEYLVCVRVIIAGGSFGQWTESIAFKTGSLLTGRITSLLEDMVTGEWSLENYNPLRQSPTSEASAKTLTTTSSTRSRSGSVVRGGRSPAGSVREEAPPSPNTAALDGSFAASPSDNNSLALSAGRASARARSRTMARGPAPPVNLARSLMTNATQPRSPAAAGLDSSWSPGRASVRFQQTPQPAFNKDGSVNTFKVVTVELEVEGKFLDPRNRRVVTPVNMQANETKKSIVNIALRPDERTFTIKNLLPDTVYLMRMRWKNTFGQWSPYTAVFPFVTLPAVRVELKSIGEHYAILLVKRRERSALTKHVIDENVKAYKDMMTVDVSVRNTIIGLEGRWDAGDQGREVCDEYEAATKKLVKKNPIMHAIPPPVDFELFVAESPAVNMQRIPTRDELVSLENPDKSEMVQFRRETTHLYSLMHLETCTSYTATARALYQSSKGTGATTTTAAAAAAGEPKGMWSDLLSLETLPPIVCKVTHCAFDWAMVEVRKPKIDTLVHTGSQYQFRLNEVECRNSVTITPGVPTVLYLTRLPQGTPVHVEARNRCGNTSDIGVDDAADMVDMLSVSRDQSFRSLDLWSPWSVLGFVVTRPKRPTIPVLYECSEEHIAFWWKTASSTDPAAAKTMPLTDMLQRVTRHKDECAKKNLEKRKATRAARRAEIQRRIAEEAHSDEDEIQLRRRPLDTAQTEQFLEDWLASGIDYAKRDVSPTAFMKKRTSREAVRMCMDLGYHEEKAELLVRSNVTDGTYPAAPSAPPSPVSSGSGSDNYFGPREYHLGTGDGFDEDDVHAAAVQPSRGHLSGLLAAQYRNIAVFFDTYEEEIEAFENELRKARFEHGNNFVMLLPEEEVPAPSLRLANKKSHSHHVKYQIQCTTYTLDGRCGQFVTLDTVTEPFARVKIEKGLKVNELLFRVRPRLVLGTTELDGGAGPSVGWKRPDPPPPVTALTASVQGTQALISWEYPSRFRHNQLYFIVQLDDAQQYRVRETEIKVVVQPYTTYRVTVVAHTTNGPSPVSKVVKIQTMRIEGQQTRFAGKAAEGLALSSKQAQRVAKKRNTGDLATNRAEEARDVDDEPPETRRLRRLLNKQKEKRRPRGLFDGIVLEETDKGFVVADAMGTGDESNGDDHEDVDEASSESGWNNVGTVDTRGDDDYEVDSLDSGSRALGSSGQPSAPYTPQTPSLFNGVVQQSRQDAAVVVKTAKSSNNDNSGKGPKEADPTSAMHLLPHQQRSSAAKTAAGISALFMNELAVGDNIMGSNLIDSSYWSWPYPNAITTDCFPPPFESPYHLSPNPAVRVTRSARQREIVRCILRRMDDQRSTQIKWMRIIRGDTETLVEEQRQHADQDDGSEGSRNTPARKIYSAAAGGATLSITRVTPADERKYLAPQKSILRAGKPDPQETELDAAAPSQSVLLPMMVLNESDTPLVVPPTPIMPPRAASSLRSATPIAETAPTPAVSTTETEAFRPSSRVRFRLPSPSDLPERPHTSLGGPKHHVPTLTSAATPTDLIASIPAGQQLRLLTPVDNPPRRSQSADLAKTRGRVSGSLDADAEEQGDEDGDNVFSEADYIFLGDDSDERAARECTPATTMEYLARMTESLPDSGAGTVGGAPSKVLENVEKLKRSVSPKTEDPLYSMDAVLGIHFNDEDDEADDVGSGDPFVPPKTDHPTTQSRSSRATMSRRTEVPPTSTLGSGHRALSPRRPSTSTASISVQMAAFHQYVAEKHKWQARRKKSIIHRGTLVSSALAAFSAAGRRATSAASNETNQQTVMDASRRESSQSQSSMRQSKSKAKKSVNIHVEGNPREQEPELRPTPPATAVGARVSPDGASDGGTATLRRGSDSEDTMWPLPFRPGSSMHGAPSPTPPQLPKASSATPYSSHHRAVAHFAEATGRSTSSHGTGVNNRARRGSATRRWTATS